jgi:deoxyribose-phosphate aldolase
LPPATQVKASGRVRALDTLLSLRPFVTRIGTNSTRAILDEYRLCAGLPVIASVDAPSGGY